MLKMVKNRLYDCCIIILVVLFIIVISLIVLKYTNQNKQEKELKNVAENIREQIEENKINPNYKGYKILGIIKIPKIDMEYPIIDKTDEKAMKVSITKFWGNNINEIGNFSMAGHNYYGGTFFGDIKKLNNGDIIEMIDLTGRKIEYEIFDKYVTDPNDVTCVNSVENNRKEITLITCTNGRSNRLIIKASEKIKG